MKPGADNIIAEECERESVKRADVLGGFRDPSLVSVRRRIARRIRDELGWSLPRIGRKLNKHHTTVLHLLSERGYVRGKHHFRTEQAREMVRVAGSMGYAGGTIAGETSEELARMFGCSKSSVCAILHGRTFRSLKRSWL